MTFQPLPPRSKSRVDPVAPLTNRGLVCCLVDWFRLNARDLPWRHTDDPYAIWVSEIMLQQTQVKTVLPYYTRWMQHLPGITELADASSDQLHKLWQGLGYYSRVRNMQKAAKLIVNLHGRSFPHAYQDVLDLPGVGPYTAGAICSIAFGQPTAILDGNITRVLARLYALGGDPAQKTTRRRLWSLAGALVAEASHLPRTIKGQAQTQGGLGSPCSQLNQALMELGALVCLPRQPKCTECPVVRFCRAHRTGRADSLPRKRRRPKAVQRQFMAFLVQDRGHYLVRQRPADTVNAHLWEFPNIEVQPAQESMEALAKGALGMRADGFTQACVVKHSITRYRITLTAYHARVRKQRARLRTGTRWLSLKQLKTLAFTAAHQKILLYLRDNPS